MSRLTLGISDDYLGNVALFADGRPLFAAANERYSRKKGDAGLPWKALETALAVAGVSLAEIDSVVMANRTHFVYRLLKRRFKGYEHDFFNLLEKVYLWYHDLMRVAGPLAAGIGALNRGLLRGQLGVDIEWCDHHEAHAWSGIASSGLEEGLVVTVDNLGDGYSTKVHSYRNGHLELLYGSSASDSPGQFYGEITQLLGYNPLRHAGKVTGLAAHGDPGPAYGLVSRLFQLTPDRKDFRLAPTHRRWRSRGIYWKLGLFSPEDIAAAAQRRLEELVRSYVAHAVEITGHRDLVLAGGVFANVKLNLAILQLPAVRTVHVHPAMSDEGLAMGAAARGQIRDGLVPAMDTVYLGSEYDRATTVEALEGDGLFSVEPADIPVAVARLLAQGYSVARFAGRFEYGPRALGNRTILFRPDDPTVNDWMNEKLGRTEFMPFAPVTLWEDAEECYLETEGARDTARHMTIAFPCTTLMKSRCPGVVHVDGTARPQLIRREDNPEYYDIVKEYKRITGLPCLINTSFNMHEEPIVESPTDAVRTFRAAGLDFLSMGGRLAINPSRSDLRSLLEDVRTGDQ